MTHMTSSVYNYNGTELLTSYNEDGIYLWDRTKISSHTDYVHSYSGHLNRATIKGLLLFLCGSVAKNSVHVVMSSRPDRSVGFLIFHITYGYLLSMAKWFGAHYDQEVRFSGAVQVLTSLLNQRRNYYY